MQINLREHVGMHNKYTFELRDAATGKIKQKAFAENVVLDTLWTWVFASTDSTTLLFGVSMGDGEGDPSASDTGLFNKVFDYQGTFSQVSIAESYPTCTYVYKIDIPASESYVGELSEVGLHASTIHSGYRVMWTHALLADSEGNPIIIEKTDLDVLTITVTLYVTFGANNYFHWVTPGANNPICRYFRNAHQGTYSPFRVSYTYLAHCATCLLDNDGCIIQATSVSGTRLGDATYTGADKLYGVTTKRLGTTAGNTGYFNGLCLYNSYYAIYMGGIVYPEPSIFPNQTLSGMSVGTGDGSTTHFNIPIEFFVENTDVVKVDGVTLTRGVDYTIDNVDELNTYSDAMNISNFLIPVSGDAIPSEYSTEYFYNFNDTVVGMDSPMMPFSHYATSSKLAATLKSDEPIVYKVADGSPCKTISSIALTNVALCAGSTSSTAYGGLNRPYLRFYEARPVKNLPTISVEESSAAAGAAIIASLAATAPDRFLTESTRGSLITKIKVGEKLVVRVIHPSTNPMYYAIMRTTDDAKYFVYVTNGATYNPVSYLKSAKNTQVKSVTIAGTTWYCYYTPIYDNDIITEPCFCVCNLLGSTTFYDGCKLCISGGSSAKGPWTNIFTHQLDTLDKLNHPTIATYGAVYGISDASCSIESASYDYYKVELDTSNATHIELMSNDDVSVYLHVLQKALNSTAINDILGNMELGYSGGGITFTTPPAAGSAITLDADIDRPYKNENFVIDASMILQF